MTDNKTRLATLNREWTGCTRCVLHKDRSGPDIVFGGGNPETEMLFVSSHPSESDDKMGVPMSGDIGDFFGQMLMQIGIDPRTCFFTTLVACRPIVRIPATELEPEQIKTRAPDKEEVEACRPRVLELVYRLDPRIIIALGEGPWKFFDGHRNEPRKPFAERVNQLHDWATPGRIETLRYPVMTTLDPGYIFSNPSAAKHGPIVSAMEAIQKAKQYIEWVKRQEKNG